MPFRDTAEEYRKTALHRLADALELFEPPTRDAKNSDALRRHLRGSVYLAGYSVECLLKAYMIKQNNVQTLNKATEVINQRRAHQGEEPIENIARSAAGHKLYYLLQLTNLAGYNAYDAKLWGRLSKWQSSWRYETDTKIFSRQEAMEFLIDVNSAVKWLSPLVD